jgi:hypothetical protein
MSELEKNNLENCKENDVLRFDDEVCLIYNLEKKIYNFLYIYAVHLADHFKSKLKIANPIREQKTNYEEWIQYGKECDILKQGQHWQKGKIMLEVKLKFIPDEPENMEENNNDKTDNIIESPLDEIRQQLTDETHS